MRAALLLLFALPFLQDAESLWARGERLAAIDRMAAELSRRPDDEALRRELVRCELAVHRPAAALAHMGERPGFEAWRGLALYRLARYEEAVPLLQEEDPQQALMRVDALLALGRLDESDAALERAAALLGREHPRILCLTGQQEAREGDDEAAVESFRSCLEVDPWDLEARYGLGRALVRLGQRDEGLAVLAEHSRLVPLFDQLDFAERGVDLAPMHAPNHARVGDVERAIGRIDRAQAAYARALELAQGEDLVPIALRAARLFDEDRHDPDAALELLDRTARRKPDVRLFVRAGDVALAAGRPGTALERFERAAALRPDDAEIAARLAAARAARVEDGQ